VEFDKIDDSVQAEIDVIYQPPSDCGGAVATTGGANDEQEANEADKRWIAIVKGNLANSNGNLAVRDGANEGGKDGAWSEETVGIKPNRSEEDDVDDAMTDETTQSEIGMDLITELPHDPVIEDGNKIGATSPQEGKNSIRNAEDALSKLGLPESMGNKKEAVGDQKPSSTGNSADEDVLHSQNQISTTKKDTMTDQGGSTMWEVCHAFGKGDLDERRMKRLRDGYFALLNTTMYEVLLVEVWHLQMLHRSLRRWREGK